MAYLTEYLNRNYNGCNKLMIFGLRVFDDELNFIGSHKIIDETEKIWHKLDSKEMSDLIQKHYFSELLVGIRKSNEFICFMDEYSKSLCKKGENILNTSI